MYIRIVYLAMAAARGRPRPAGGATARRGRPPAPRLLAPRRERPNRTSSPGLFRDHLGEAAGRLTLAPPPVAPNRRLHHPPPPSDGPAAKAAGNPARESGPTVVI